MLPEFLIAAGYTTHLFSKQMVHSHFRPKWLWTIGGRITKKKHPPKSCFRVSQIAAGIPPLILKNRWFTPFFGYNYGQLYGTTNKNTHSNSRLGFHKLPPDIAIHLFLSRMVPPYFGIITTELDGYKQQKYTTQVLASGVFKCRRSTLSHSQNRWILHTFGYNYLDNWGMAQHPTKAHPRKSLLPGFLNCRRSVPLSNLKQMDPFILFV